MLSPRPRTAPNVLDGDGILGLYDHALSAPLAVLFELTHRCNLRCVHCFANAGPAGDSHLSLDEWKRLGDEIAALQVPVVFLSGGEPLLYPGLLDLVRHLHDRDLFLCLLSNLTRIDEPMATALVEAGVDKVEGNLDGATAEVYDRFRGVRGSFHRTIRGIRACLAADLPLRVNATLTSINVHEVEEICRLALELGVRDLAFLPLIESGRGGDDFSRLALPPEVYEGEIKPRLAALVERYENQLHILYQGDADMMAWGDPAGALPACGAGRIHCTVTSAGLVKPDVYFDDDDPAIIAGDVRRQRFADVWRDSPVLRSMRRVPSGPCELCDDRNCAGGDLYRAYRYHGTLMNGPDPLCPRLVAERAG